MAAIRVFSATPVVTAPQTPSCGDGGIDYSNAVFTVCPEIPSPRTPYLTENAWEKQRRTGADPQHLPDQNPPEKTFEEKWRARKADPKKTHEDLLPEDVIDSALPISEAEESEFFNDAVETREAKIAAALALRAARNKLRRLIKNANIDTEKLLILHLREFEGLSYGIIGHRLGISDGYAEHLYKKAVAELEKASSGSPQQQSLLALPKAPPPPFKPRTKSNRGRKPKVFAVTKKTPTAGDLFNGFDGEGF